MKNLLSKLKIFRAVLFCLGGRLRIRLELVAGNRNAVTGGDHVCIVGDFLDVSEVKELCRSKLPAYEMPRKINLVDQLSKNGSGKIIRSGNYAGI